MYASDYRRIARDRLANNWWLSIGVAAIACLLGGLIYGSAFLPEFRAELQQEEFDILELANGTLRFSMRTGSFFAMAQFILGGVVQLGYAKYLLAQHDHRELKFNDLFSEFDRFGIGFAQKFLRSLYVFLWSLLFVIPGIIANYRYAMTPYILADNPNMTASEAINYSKYMMDGHKGELFCLHLSFFGWSILSAATLNLGHLALNPYKNAAVTAFYRNLLDEIHKKHKAGYV